MRDALMDRLLHSKQQRLNYATNAAHFEPRWELVAKELMFSLRRALLAVTISPLPFLWLGGEWLFLAAVLSASGCSLCLLGKRQHLVTVPRLLITAACGYVVAAAIWSDQPASMRSAIPMVLTALIGTTGGMFVGWFWGEKYYAEQSDRNSRGAKAEKYRWVTPAVALLLLLTVLGIVSSLFVVRHY